MQSSTLSKRKLRVHTYSLKNSNRDAYWVKRGKHQSFRHMCVSGIYITTTLCHVLEKEREKERKKERKKERTTCGRSRWVYYVATQIDKEEIE